MRGVASGGDGVHDGTVPSVGVYLDEQPVTTIQGVLDIHIYDIARVEALAGPQGTLYGASSEAGTLRIITNKPEFDVLKGAYDIQANDVAHGRPGYTGEGYINIPINSAAAIRLVGWYEKDGGYIDNVPGSLTYPATYSDGKTGSGFTINNGPTPSNPAPNTRYTGTAKNAYNDVETVCARAALRIALGDHWTITPTVQGQELTSNGIPAMEMTKSVPGYPGLYPTLGDLEVQHFNPETQTDDWTQATLTIEGNISNFDLTYAGGYLHRNSTQTSDYADYSLAYELKYTHGPHYFTDNAGNPISPTQQIKDTDGYKMYSHELRVSTPKDFPVRATFGGFTQLQTNAYIQNYSIPGPQRCPKRDRMAGHLLFDR
jgi:outer membrane receptor protein involved in Fe transport